MNIIYLYLFSNRMSFILEGIKMFGNIIYTTVKITFISGMVIIAAGSCILYCTKPPLDNLKKQVEKDIESNSENTTSLQKVGISIAAKLMSKVPTYTNKDCIILNISTVKILDEGFIYIGIFNQWIRFKGKLSDLKPEIRNFIS